MRLNQEATGVELVTYLRLHIPSRMQMHTVPPSQGRCSKCYEFIPNATNVDRNNYHRATCSPKAERKTPTRANKQVSGATSITPTQRHIDWNINPQPHHVCRRYSIWMKQSQKQQLKTAPAVLSYYLSSTVCCGRRTVQRMCSDLCLSVPHNYDPSERSPKPLHVSPGRITSTAGKSREVLFSSFACQTVGPCGCSDLPSSL